MVAIVSHSEILFAKDAIPKIRSSLVAKFVESLDVAVCLNLDVRKSEEQVRGAALLPHSQGKPVRVAVFSKDGSVIAQAKELGADLCGGDELVEEIRTSGSVKVREIDWFITTPDCMPTLAKVAKILGPRGLMPNPKLGTVTNDIIEKLKVLKSGRVVKFKTDKAGIIHAKIGGFSLSDAELFENFDALIKVLKQCKPSAAKGVYFKSVFLNSTMGKSVKVALDSRD